MSGEPTVGLQQTRQMCPESGEIPAGAFFLCPGVGLRITRGDGLIDRDQAAELCGVTPDAVTAWAQRGYMVTVQGERVRRFLPVAKREGRRPLYDPVEVQKAEFATRKRGRRDVPRVFPVAA